MADLVGPEVLVYQCANCVPGGGRLPRQWIHDGVRVVVHEIPCSGKLDIRYLLHALEAGARGVCVVACSKGECHLTQGNYRAEIRVHTVQTILAEAGLEPERVELRHVDPNESPERHGEVVREAVARLVALGPSALRSVGHATADS